MNKCDNDLFCKLCAPTHALNHLLPPTRSRVSLRTRGNSYQLPEYSTDLHKKYFLIRSLCSFVKRNSFFWFCCLVLYVSPVVLSLRLNVVEVNWRPIDWRWISVAWLCVARWSDPSPVRFYICSRIALATAAHLPTLVLLQLQTTSDAPDNSSEMVYINK